MSPIERYAMRFVEETGANWAAIQLKAVEMEIEQQKREWEEKRLAQQQQQELEKQNVEKDESELLTYSREDSLNKVNIKSNKKSILGKRKFENVNHSSRTLQNSKNSSSSNNSNGTATQNGMMKENDKSINNNKKEKEKIIAKSPPKNVDGSFKRTTRNTSRTTEDNSVGKPNSRITSILPRQRAMSRKSDISSSSKSKKTVRSTSESTNRSTSMSRQTSIQEDSDSECSLDVMVDSNDVNDSDSNNSNHKAESNFDSTSQDDDTIINDDSTITDETTIEKFPKSLQGEKKSTSSPRTRSRGTVNLNLWTLDDSPILPIKRQKVSTSNSSKNVDKLDDLLEDEKKVKKEFGVKECKISMIDIQQKKPNATPSPQSRANKKLLSSVKNNHKLDSWIKKMPDPPLKAKQQITSSNDEDNTPKIRPRRVVAMQNKTL